MTLTTLKRLCRDSIKKAAKSQAKPRLVITIPASLRSVDKSAPYGDRLGQSKTGQLYKYCPVELLAWIKSLS